MQWFSLLYSRAMWTEMKVTLTLLMLKVCRKCDCFTTVYVTIWIMWPVYKKTTDRWTQSEASLHIPQVPNPWVWRSCRDIFKVTASFPFHGGLTPAWPAHQASDIHLHTAFRDKLHVFALKNNCFWSSVVLSPVLMNSKLPFYRLPDSNIFTKLLSVCWTILMKLQCLDVY